MLQSTLIIFRYSGIWTSVLKLWSIVMRSYDAKGIQRLWRPDHCQWGAKVATEQLTATSTVPCESRGVLVLGPSRSKAYIIVWVEWISFLDITLDIPWTILFCFFSFIYDSIKFYTTVLFVFSLIFLTFLTSKYFKDWGHKPFVHRIPRHFHSLCKTAFSEVSFG